MLFFGKFHFQQVKNVKEILLKSGSLKIYILDNIERLRKYIDGYNIMLEAI